MQTVALVQATPLSVLVVPLMFAAHVAPLVGSPLTIVLAPPPTLLPTATQAVRLGQTTALSALVVPLEAAVQVVALVGSPTVMSPAPAPATHSVVLGQANPSSVLPVLPVRTVQAVDGSVGSPVTILPEAPVATHSVVLGQATANKLGPGKVMALTAVQVVALVGSPVATLPA
jgi:hypothetical protein